MKFFDSFKEALQLPGKHIHIVAVGTKPDIIKQAPLFHALKNAGANVIVGHTGQHYDHNLSGGLIDELGVEPAYNFEIKGTVQEKVAAIWTGVGKVIEECEKHNKIPIFYVHGDTMTASSVGGASHASAYPTVHIEAGIRTYGPDKETLKQIINGGDLDWDWFYKAMQDSTKLVGGSMEPFPEQFNTRSAGPGAGLMFAPDEFAESNLKAEGFRMENIYNHGNTVADITREMLAKTGESKIFEEFPLLKNGFIRFCIHRRENCSSRERFLAIFEAMEEMAQTDNTILLILMNQTKSAIKNFGLEDRLEALRKMPNVIVSEVWPYYKDVIAAMEKATLCVTDSGSMQEEMHIMKIPCVTLRYGTDRPETLLAGSNVIAPPHNKDVVLRVVESALDHLEELSSSNQELYGVDVSKQIAETVLNRLKDNHSLFKNEYEIAEEFLNL